MNGMDADYIIHYMHGLAKDLTQGDPEAAAVCIRAAKAIEQMGRLSELRDYLLDFAVTPAIDMHEDGGPALTGWTCKICDGESDSRDRAAVEHQADCPLAVTGAA